jgi:hypothetical protein
VSDCAKVSSRSFWFVVNYLSSNLNQVKKGLIKGNHRHRKMSNPLVGFHRTTINCSQLGNSSEASLSLELPFSRASKLNLKMKKYFS